MEPTLHVRVTRRTAALSLTAAAAVTAAFGTSSSGGLAAHLVARHAPVPFVHTHADGGFEGLSDPAAEQYDNRAWPRQYIDPAQSNGARAAFTKLAHGNSTKSGGGTVTSGPTTGGSSDPLSGWSEVGPTTTTDNSKLLAYGGVPRSISGRALALLVLPGCDTTRCDLYVGTAGGGVWHTANALGAQGTQDWQSVNAGLTTNAVDSLSLVNGVIYAGTGEPDGSNDSEAGRGLFSMPVGGSTWSLVPGSDAVATDRALAAVWVDPTDSNHIVIGTAAARHGASAVWGGRAFPPGAPKLGAYATTDGGAHWTQVLAPAGDNAFLGGVTNLQKDPNSSALYAGVVGYGLYRLSGGSSTLVFKSASYGQPGAGIGGGRVELALVNDAGKTRAYLGDSDTVGGSTVWRTDDVSAVTTTTWQQLSDKNPAHAGYAVYGYCETQCGYDDFIVTNPNNPDEVFVGGSAHYKELGPDYAGVQSPSNGRDVMRSEDGGATWTDMSQDASNVDGVYTELHPDQHALALVPNSSSFFETSDGGVVREDNPTIDRSGECATRAAAKGGLTATQVANCQQWLSAVPQKITSLNDGLATVQFQSLSTDSAGDLLGGTQDNGTLDYASGGAPSSWFETIFGDGGQSGFDAKNSAIRYHNYYDATPDVNFHGSGTSAEISHWDWIGDPLQKETPSFYIPFLADPKLGGYVWAGLQHVWRTTDNGGSQSFLDTYCNEFSSLPTKQPCGDWQATGGGGSGGTYYQGSAGDAGDLTGVYFGQDRKGEFVSQVARATDSSTLWAGTRTGRVFISKNVNTALPQNVRYTRIDTPSTPGRFVSGIYVDPTNPNHAWITYSGYVAYDPNPHTGHVYSVTFNPATGKAAWTDLSYNLGDIPITAVAVSPSGDVFAGTDFGVAHLAPGASAWNVPDGTLPPGDGALPVVSVFSLLVSPDGHTLYAATHGRGAWKLSIATS